MKRSSVPTVSVVMPSYNHAHFINTAIDSVLNQSFQDLELIIVDDGSRDESASLISKVTDDRVRSIILERNVGACEAMNIAVRESRGRYVAVCNSDDEWHPQKLARQFEFLEKNVGIAAVFSNVVWIDDTGKPLKRMKLPPFASVFKQSNRSRYVWLRDLLSGGNCLCHPSVLLRRQVFENIGLYDNRLRQLPDLDIWIRLLQQYEIFVMSDTLVGFRLHDNNTSAPSPKSSRRSINEHRIILDKTFDEISLENFASAFGTKCLQVRSGTEFQIEKALYLLEYRGLYESMHRYLGLNRLYGLLGEPEAVQILESNYGIDVASFHEELGRYSPWLYSETADSGSSAAQSFELVRTVDVGKLLLRRIGNRAMRFFGTR